MANEMTAYVLHGEKDLRAEKRPLPKAGPGQVLIEVQRMGICGSDIHYYEHGYCGSYIPKRPFILGHEFSGRIADVGEGVERLSPGDHVAIDPSQFCGKCEFCMGGRYNLCVNFKYLGSAAVDPHVDGAFAQYIAMPETNCYQVPEDFDYDIAAMMEPMSVAMHGVMRAGGVSGLSVLITGGGTIGQMVLMVAKEFGAANIVVSDIAKKQREFALKQGANAVLDPTQKDAEEQAKDLSNGGFQVIIEASGAIPALQQAIHFARRGATIVQIGTLPAEVPLPANLIMVKELQLLGSLRFANVFGIVLDMTVNGRFDLRPLISRTFPFEQLVEGIQLAGHGDGMMKVQVEA